MASKLNMKEITLVKQITTDAGADAINPEKDMLNIIKHLYAILFIIKRMPEYYIKWSIKKEIEPTIRGLLRKFTGGNKDGK